MNRIPLDWYYSLCALLMWSLALIMIPREKWKPLFWYGIIWGFFVGCVFAWVFGSWLHLYEYRSVEPFKAFGTNVWLNFAWIPAIMIYLHHLPSGRLWYGFPLYLIIFALASASLDEVFHGAGLLQYIHWNSLIRFIVAFIWFWGVKIYYLATIESFKGKEKI